MDVVRDGRHLMMQGDELPGSLQIRALLKQAVGQMVEDDILRLWTEVPGIGRVAKALALGARDQVFDSPIPDHF